MLSINSTIQDVLAKLKQYENIILATVFLFPIAGAFVRHWISDLFVLLFLFSLVFWKKSSNKRLEKEEVFFLWGIFAYFLVFILTSFVNGWGEKQTYWLLLELRFIAIIPIYFLLRNIQGVGQSLLWGVFIGVILTFCWAVYELYIMSPESYFELAHFDPANRRLNGVYSVLFIGPYVLLLSAFLIPAAKLLPKLEKHKWVIAVLLLAGVFMVATSGARNAYLGLLTASLVTGLYYYHSKKIIISLIVIIVVSLAAWNFSDLVKSRIEKALYQYEQYTYADDHLSLKNSGGSIGKRLELWRAAIHLIRENPVFGVGRGNFNKELRKLVDEGIINPVIKDYSQPHNLYLEVAVSRGGLGLGVLLWLLYYPLFVFIKTRKSSPHTALLGILHIVIISVISLTEAATFIKGNYVAIFLVFLSVFYMWHLNILRQNN
jgi:O-antigen ligase